MEGLFMVQDLIERDCYVRKIDLKDAYIPNHHKGSKVFKVSMETGAVSVSDTFIRVLMKSTISFHQQMKPMTK